MRSTPAIASAALLVTACMSGPASDPRVCANDQPDELRPLETLGYVAHAGGAPDGLLQTPRYTNSLEAFEMSYANGFRAFELDFITLGDGTVMAAHDNHEDHYGLDVAFTEATRADLENARYDGQYTPLFLDDVIALMQAHPDVWLIVDSKWDHVAIAEAFVDTASPGVLDRVVPHLTSASHTEALAELYPFPERMMALYWWSAEEDDPLVERMDRHGVDNVMMWWNWRWSEATQSTLENAGHHVWVHTPEEKAEIERFRERGVGVYSNGYVDFCLE